MAIMNYTLAIPVLCIFGIPLAIGAVFTTMIASCILFYRLVMIYIELAIGIVPYILSPALPSMPATASPTSATYPSDYPPPPRRRRRRRSSSSSALSGGSITPVYTDPPGLLGLPQSVGPTRDYEGVGGWRLGDDASDEETWKKFNAKLELPSDHAKRHRRSATGGSIGARRRSLSPEAIGMNSGKMRAAKTPSEGGLGAGYNGNGMGDGYFPLVERRRGSCSNQSSGSSGILMKAREC